ncbi:hypothetical protein [Roseateles violae]|uniref:Uncharacterized protein n=1 Tax=Roseateles violae TaxID=3058042 RepID=A0ABT8DTU4_9BURK|nr:hypothetical protein [Pelomonas sp. PFR6]MDN3921501.1 hypothetical protein [Pelomonas sp. PFR6]
MAIKPLIRFTLARLREPSTLASLAALATLFGLPPGTVDLAAQVVGGIAGLVAIVKPDAHG